MTIHLRRRSVDISVARTVIRREKAKLLAAQQLVLRQIGQPSSKDVVIEEISPAQLYPSDPPPDCKDLLPWPPRPRPDWDNISDCSGPIDGPVPLLPSSVCHVPPSQTHLEISPSPPPSSISEVDSSPPPSLASSEEDLADLLAPTECADLPPSPHEEPGVPAVVPTPSDMIDDGSWSGRDAVPFHPDDQSALVSTSSGLHLRKNLRRQPARRPWKRLKPGDFSTDDWQFHPEEFDILDAAVGPFTIDVCSDEKGSNAMVSRFFSRKDSCLEHNWARETVWCNPPGTR